MVQVNGMRTPVQRFSSETRGQGEVFNFVPLAQRFALGGEASDADKFGLVWLEKGKSSHRFVCLLFATDSPGKFGRQACAGRTLLSAALEIKPEK